MGAKIRGTADSDSCDVGGEEVGAVTVEVAACSVVVLGAAWVCVAREDLNVPESHAGIERVSDGSVAKRVRTDMSGDSGGPGNPSDHAIGVALVNRVASQWSQDQATADPFTSARFEDTQDWDGDGHCRGLVAFADQVEHAVPAECLGVVLDLNCCGFGCSKGIDAEEVGQRSMVHRDCLRDLEEPDELEAVEALGA
jgi:hypothetical protein